MRLELQVWQDGRVWLAHDGPEPLEVTVLPPAGASFRATVPGGLQEVAPSHAPGTPWLVGWLRVGLLTMAPLEEGP